MVPVPSDRSPFSELQGSRRIGARPRSLDGAKASRSRDPDLSNCRTASISAQVQTQLVERSRPGEHGGGYRRAVCYVLNLELNLENLKETKYETVTN